MACNMQENPFPDITIADWTFLDASGGRSNCPKCGKSRKYYCYNCLVPLPSLSAEMPKVKLPIMIDIIKHPSETDGKSTAPHAVIIAPEHVSIHTYPCIPDYDPVKVVVVFPCKESLTLEDIASSAGKMTAESKEVEQKNQLSNDCEQDSSSCTDALEETKPNSSDEIGKNKTKKRVMEITDISTEETPPTKVIKKCNALPFEKVVFIDSTWNQTNNIVNDERLKKLRKIELRSRNTHFWRSQDGIPRSYLSTIEAIYYFLKDFHLLFIDSDYNHEYDNLLFFFCFMYQKIQSNLKGKKQLKAYQR
ncbi:tRNA-uridine aminocarboxypropyltransferase 1-like isoform X2 [Physella acuta]|uniref:tRNA-uridine aminocarboxypropyltransferase 1-like isoform X2 n=1 Tax=Physella acuta TaxID=109671 RepID=UPI0027DB3E26|nr:tRNA-uridine aminocarboxypropyltransferase 1-like isoform X2 [Physella acuta]